MQRRRDYLLAAILTLAVNAVGVLLLVRVQSRADETIVPFTDEILRPMSVTLAATEKRPTPETPEPERERRAPPRPSLALPELPSAIQASELMTPDLDPASLLRPILGREIDEVSGLASLILDEDAVDVAPVARRQIDPEYPRRAYELGLEGSVLVRILVNREGRVIDAIIEQADPPDLFDATVLRAVRRWEFTPALYRGQPVAVWVRVPFTFTLRS